MIVYSYDTAHDNHTSKSSYENEILFNDDSYRVFNTQTDDTDSMIDDSLHDEASFQVPHDLLPHENLSVITEESSFLDEINVNDENNSIKILYDLIKKPHWTMKGHLPRAKSSAHPEANSNSSVSSNPSSLSLDSISGDASDDDEEYDQEKGRELIERLIEETLARR